MKVRGRTTATRDLARLSLVAMTMTAGGNASAAIDTSQPYFTETSSEATTDPIVFNGGTLRIDNPAFSTSASITLMSAGGTVTTNAASTTVLSGVISGAGSFTKSGNGAVTFSGANTYTGTTSVSAGALIASGGSAISDTSTVNVASGASFRVQSSETIGSLAGAGSVEIASGTLSFGSSYGDFSGVISGAGGIEKVGGGWATLSGANTYTGGTTISGGTLTGTTTSLQGDIVNNGTLYITQSFDGSFTGGVSGSGNLIKSGTGSVTLSGTNTYTGGTNIYGGSLTLSEEASISASSSVYVESGASLNLVNGGTIRELWGSGSVNVASGTLTVSNDSSYYSYMYGVISGAGALTKTGSGTLSLTGANTYTGGTTVEQGTLSGTTTSLRGDIVNNGTVSFSQSTDGTFSGAISGTGAVNFSGAGAVTLSGTNTYTGATTVSYGTLVLSGGSAISDSSRVIVGYNGTLRVDQSETIGSLGAEYWWYTSGTVNIVSGTLTVGGDNTSTNFGGALTGAGSLVKTGTGTLTLEGTDTHTGGTIISGGTLAVTTSGLTGDVVNNANLTFSQYTDGTYSGVISGTGSVTKSGYNGKVTLTGANTYTGGTTISSGTLAGTTTSLQGNIVDNAALQFDQSADGAFSGVISGTGNVYKYGTGAVTLSGANSYSGSTSVYAGALSVTGGSALSDTASVNVVSGATLNVLDSEKIGSLYGSGSVNLASGTLTLSNSYYYYYYYYDNSYHSYYSDFSGVISGAGALKTSGSGTAWLSGANTYTGGTTIESGSLFGTTTSIQGNVVNNGNLLFNQSTDGTFAGSISGTGSLYKFGTGVVTLSGTNTHTGSTNVYAGTLAVTGGAALPDASTVYLASGTTLKVLDSEKIGALYGSGAVDVASGTLTLSGGNTGSYYNYAPYYYYYNSVGGYYTNYYSGYTYGYSGAISGAGGIRKVGDNTVRLTGTNTYTGGTTIDEGWLIGTTTGLQGKIVNNASLEFDQSFDGDFSGSISGTGSLYKEGSGAVAFSGNNIYTGSTVVWEGTLAARGGSAIPDASSVSVSSGAVLRVDESETIGSLNGSGTVNAVSGTLTIGADNRSTTFGGAISGAGRLAKTGTGTLTLGGANTFTGGAWVGGGALRVLGSLSGLTEVVSGGTLLGTGTVASLLNGGVVSPGSTGTIGTLKVTGNYAQTSSGTLVVDITPTSSDKLSVGGTASLDGGVQVRPTSGTYAVGTTYHVLSAGSVSGTFRSVAIENADRLGSLTLGVSYLSNGVDLKLMTQIAASSTQQEQAVKTVAPEVARQAVSLQNSLIGTRIASVFAPRGVTSSAPSNAPSTTPGTIDGGATKKDTSSLSGLAAGDDAAPDDRFGGLSVWGDAGAAYLRNVRSASKYHGWLKSAVLGVDYRLGDTWVVGAALSPDQTSLKLSSVDGDRDTAGIGVSLYAGYKIDDTYSVSVIGGYGRAFVNGKQSVAGVDVKDSYGSNRYNAQVALSAGYTLGDDIRLSPTISYTHAIETTSKHHSDDGAEVKLPTSSLGTIRAEARLELTANNVFVPFLVGGVEHDIVNSGGSTGRTGFTAGGGVQVPYDENVSLGALAVADFGRDGQSTFRFGANARFSW